MSVLLWWFQNSWKLLSDSHREARVFSGQFPTLRSRHSFIFGVCPRDYHLCPNVCSNQSQGSVFSLSTQLKQFVMGPGDQDLKVPGNPMIAAAYTAGAFQWNNNSPKRGISNPTGTTTVIHTQQALVEGWLCASTCGGCGGSFRLIFRIILGRSHNWNVFQERLLGLKALSNLAQVYRTKQ